MWPAPRLVHYLCRLATTHENVNLGGKRCTRDYTSHAHLYSLLCPPLLLHSLHEFEGGTFAAISKWSWLCSNLQRLVIDVWLCGRWARAMDSDCVRSLRDFWHGDWLSKIVDGCYDRRPSWLCSDLQFAECCVVVLLLGGSNGRRLC